MFRLVGRHNRGARIPNLNHDGCDEMCINIPRLVRLIILLKWLDAGKAQIAYTPVLVIHARLWTPCVRDRCTYYHERVGVHECGLVH